VLSVAAVGGLATVTGCGTAGRDDGSVGDDRSLAEAAMGEEQAFGVWCAKVARRHRTLRPDAQRVARAQRLYVAALADALGVPPPTASSPAAVPGSPRAAARLLARRSDALCAGRAADALTSADGALAQLLASMSAGHAVTAERWRR
jgi:hypothetical protein